MKRSVKVEVAPTKYCQLRMITVVSHQGATKPRQFEIQRQVSLFRLVSQKEICSTHPKGRTALCVDPSTSDKTSHRLDNTSMSKIACQILLTSPCTFWKNKTLVKRNTRRVDSQNHGTGEILDRTACCRFDLCAQSIYTPVALH